jgi:hypothetical protein
MGAGYACGVEQGRMHACSNARRSHARAGGLVTKAEVARWCFLMGRSTRPFGWSLGYRPMKSYRIKRPGATNSLRRSKGFNPKGFECHWDTLNLSLDLISLF